MGALSSKLSLFLRLPTLALACSVAFLVGGLTSPAPRSATDPAMPPPSPPAPTEAPESLDLSSAFAAIEELNASGESFRVHQLALRVSKRLNSSELQEMLKRSKSLEGGEATIVSIIFAIDLAYRNTPALVQALNDPSFLEGSPLDVALLFRYWAKASPEAAFASAFQLASPAREQALNGVANSGDEQLSARVADYYRSPQHLEDRGRAQRETLIAAIDNETWRSDRNAFLQQFHSAFASAPHLGIEHALRIDNPQIRQQLLRQLLHAKWPDPLEALRTIKELSANGHIPNPQRRSQFIVNVLHQADESSFGPALDWLGGELTPYERASLLRSLPLRSADAVIGALESPFFQDIPDSPLKFQFLQNAIARYSAADWRSSVDLILASLPPASAEAAIANVVPQAFASSGAEAATSLLASLETSAARSQAIRQLAGRWGAQDPLGFIRWTLEQPEEWIQEQHIHTAATQWAETDRRSLMAFESELETGFLKSSLQGVIARALSHHAPLEAMEYALRFENIDQAVPFLATAAANLGKTDPQQAAAFIASTLPEEQYALYSIDAIAREWARRDPEQAVAYFHSLPQETLAERGVGASLGLWFGVDSQAAAAFAESLPAGPERDRVLVQSGMLQSISPNDPEMARRLFELIEDPTTREHSLRQYENANFASGSTP